MIKFRVWDLADGLYYDNNSCSYYDGNLPIGDYDKVDQFTGMYDKNNKEIYTGDLIRITNPKCFIQEQEIIYSVLEPKNGCWMYKVEEIIRWEGYSVPPPKIGQEMFCINYQLCNIEVIGNVYET